VRITSAGHLLLNEETIMRTRLSRRTLGLAVALAAFTALGATPARADHWSRGSSRSERYYRYSDCGSYRPRAYRSERYYRYYDDCGPRRSGFSFGFSYNRGRGDCFRPAPCYRPYRRSRCDW
jgi:hypothetical protein